MHCLPVRRNVIVTDAVIDSAEFVVIDEAENRLHVQKAISRQSLLVNRYWKTTLRLAKLTINEQINEY